MSYWSLVIAAGRRGTEQGREALASLCESYWHPLYAYIRRRGYDVDEARDLTQGYFARLFEKEYVNQVQPRAGRFRSFLLTPVKHFLANEWNKAHAAKRSGSHRLISLDTASAEERYRLGTFVWDGAILRAHGHAGKHRPRPELARGAEASHPE